MSKRPPNVRPTLRVTTDEGYSLIVRRNKRRKQYYALLTLPMQSNFARGGFKSAEAAEAWGRAISVLEGSKRPVYRSSWLADVFGNREVIIPKDFM